MARPKSKPVEPELDDDLEDDEPEETESGRTKRLIPFDVSTMPAGVRAVLKLKPWRDAETYTAQIYRRVNDPEKPGRIINVWKAKIYNTEIDEAYLAERYAAPFVQTFRVMYLVPNKKVGGDAHLFTDDFTIDAQKAPAMVAPGGGPAPVGAPAPSGDPLLARAQSLRELRDLAEIMILLKGDTAAAAPAMAPGMNSPAWMEALFKERFKHLEDMIEKTEKKMIAPASSQNGHKDGDDAWPEFIRPWAPQIKAFGIRTLSELAEKLSGKGLQSMGLRYLVLDNPDFKAVWSDLEKRNKAAQALVESLGSAGENLIRIFAEELERGKAGAP